MSVRVVARIRPLLSSELQKDVIVSSARTSTEGAQNKTSVRIPNPRNDAESFSFHFNSVYDDEASQSHIYDNEVAPTVKHLFKGYDVTLFAYGVTGTGKTHTMRGGKALAERGVIPRLLSSIYRRARKMEKDGGEQSRVEVRMSYYEIYNDKVFDLFEPPEKRTAAGLSIRDNEKGKAIVVGLTEKPCATLKEFEVLYDQANVNRSTSATKLNAHSSRSHAILSVKLCQTVGDERRVSTVSAIDLAGSEDNRRTENNKERMVESAAINKSLFVLGQCVEAIGKKQARIPYRESKMTRILALGQNSGHTIMILNLAPVKSYHLDTLSSLNLANRTIKIEMKEIENQPFFREGMEKKRDGGEGKGEVVAPALHRQPLRPKALTHIDNNGGSNTRATAAGPKPMKAFAVFSDKTVGSGHSRLHTTMPSSVLRVRSPKRTKTISTAGICAGQGMSATAIEALIERKVSEALAERVDNTTNTVLQSEPLSEEVQKRLDALERRVEGQENERAEGLQYLLMAKQHQVRGEDGSALKMYQLALPYFPGNEKLTRKMEALREKTMASKVSVKEDSRDQNAGDAIGQGTLKSNKKRKIFQDDESYHEDKGDDESDEEFCDRPRGKVRRHFTASDADVGEQTPRTKHLLNVVNSRDVGEIQSLKGVGMKRAEAIVKALLDLEEEVGSLDALGQVKGIGGKVVEKMRAGLVV